MDPRYTDFVTQNYSILCKFFPQLFILGLFCSLLSPLSLIFSAAKHPLEDDNLRDALLSLIALKRRVASLVLGLLQVVLML